MLESALNGILSSVTASGVTELFLWGIVALFSIAMIMSIFNLGARFVANAPNLLTSVGILGTFIGIVIGLMGFDPSNIDESIGLLLEGLKTAFITSLSGMGGSIIFKIVSPLFVRKPKKGKDEPVGELLENLRIAIAGEEESSLAGQIKLFRSDIRDNNDQRRNSFSEFSNKLRNQLDDVSKSLARGATEQVIEALKQVITDFNNNLTEQFGDNFKALDASVQKLVEWQEKYRIQLDQMSEQYQNGVNAIDSTKDSVGAIQGSLSDIRDNSQSITTTMDSLGQVITTNQNQINNLSDHLKAFGDIKDRAESAIPEIRKYADKTISDISDVSEAVGEHSKSVLDKLSNNHDKITDGITTIHEHMEGSVQQVCTDVSNTISVTNESVDMIKEASNTVLENTGVLTKELHNNQIMVTSKINDMQQRMEDSMDAIFHKQTEVMNTALSGVTTSIEKVVNDTSEGVNHQISDMDTAMQEEVNRVMTEMGKSLSEISGQFTTDYRKLVGAMQKIVSTGSQH